MSDPFGRTRVMDEMRVTATDFRVHLKDLGNHVARGGAAVVVARHGLELGVFINKDEYAEFLKWRTGPAAKQETVEVPEVHPEELPIEEVERIYRATAGKTDELTVRWRRWAAQLMQARLRNRSPPS